MKKMTGSEFQLGRFIVGRLPHGEDLISAIENFCASFSIQMATFSLTGAVSSYTIGTYDHTQHVYVTATEEANLEILTCTGNISPMNGSLLVHAHIVLGDKNGNTTGGRLFSETTIFAGEINLQELKGKPPERTYDEQTGLSLWKIA